MFQAIITCAVALSCGLTGEFRSNRVHPTKAICLEQTTMAMQLIGEDPARFKIVCKAKAVAHGSL